MRSNLLVLAFAFLTASAFSQSADSLKVLNRVDSLIRESRTLISQNDTSKALETIVLAEKLTQEFFGKESAPYANVCISYGWVLHNKSDISAAEPWYLKSKNIRAKILGTEHPDYARSLNNLGLLEHDLGNYAAAEPLYLEAKRINAKVLGIDSQPHIRTLTNISRLYYDKGEYDKAELLNKEVREIRIKLSGKETTAYAWLLNNIANIYDEKGEYDQAELLFLESIEIKVKLSGKDNLDYATTIGNLGIMYFYKGDYSKAEPLFLEAKAIKEQSLGKNHPEYASSLNSLALLYKIKGDYNKAEPLYLEAKEIWAKTQGNERRNYAAALNNLALLYKAKGDYNQAEPLYLEAKEIWAKTLGEEHPDYATSLNGLAGLYFEKGNFQKAEKLYLQAREIRAKTLGMNHPDYAATIHNLALLYQKINQIPKSAALFIESNKINRLIIERSSNYSSETEMIAFLSTFEEELAGLQSISLIHATPELCQESYNNVLFFTGITLENDRILARAIAGADSTTRSIYEKWQGCHRRLAKRYARPIGERKKIAEVEAEAETYEKMLMRSLPDFREARKVPKWQDVQKHLKQDEAAIAFLHFRFYTPDESDSTMYAALLLRPGWKAPKLISLFEEKQLDSLLFTTGERKADYVAHLYSMEDRGIIVNEKPVRSLFELCWKPLENEMAGVKTVYFSSTGLLHRLNLSAIPFSADSTLADRYQLIELGSTRHLVAAAEPVTPNNHAILFGGIQYEMDSTAIFAANKKLNSMVLASLEDPLNAGDAARGGSWNYLKWTEKEVNAISPILVASGLVPETLKGFNATEEAFKSIGVNEPSPRILHLATHGFFFPDPKDTLHQRKILNEGETGFKTSHNPLIRSGLLLAGANYAWETGKPLKKNMENGILTAYEISHMDLSHTELVVLSACETGLGDIKGNEGVYGLQRAFKIAGAKYLIMSLWQVPDFQTQELMTTFYSKWLEKKMAIPEAFHAAQKEMREKYNNPYFWAGFVLVE